MEESQGYVNGNQEYIRGCRSNAAAPLSCKSECLFFSDLCDMRINSVVPVKEAFCVDHVTDLKAFDSLINLGVVTAQVRLNGEGVGITANGNVEVEVAVGIM